MTSNSAAQPQTSPTLLVWVVWLLIAAAPLQALGSPNEAPSEYLVKAQLLVRFLRYVEWPPDSLQGETLIILVIGNDPEEKYFDDLRKKLIKGKKLEIRRINKVTEETVLTSCHILFIGRGQRKAVKDLIPQARARNILTIGEFSDFLDGGGMINFIQNDNRIQFEINQKTSSEEGLRIPSDLLKLAVRVHRKN